jgi:hypothetical protein
MQLADWEEALKQNLIYDIQKFRDSTPLEFVLRFYKISNQEITAISRNAKLLKFVASKIKTGLEDPQYPKQKNLIERKESRKIRNPILRFDPKLVRKTILKENSIPAEVIQCFEPIFDDKNIGYLFVSHTRACIKACRKRIQPEHLQTLLEQNPSICIMQAGELLQFEHLQRLVETHPENILRHFQSGQYPIDYRILLKLFKSRPIVSLNTFPEEFLKVPWPELKQGLEENVFISNAKKDPKGPRLLAREIVKATTFFHTLIFPNRENISEPLKTALMEELAETI